LRSKESRLKETVDRLLDEEQIVFCGIVELELLHGFRPDERNRFVPLFDVLPYVEVDREDWRSASELLAGLRARGISIPATDALIAALCRRHDLMLLTLDQRFRQIPKLAFLPI
jgi:hypothetical protein